MSKSTGEADPPAAPAVAAAAAASDGSGAAAAAPASDGSGAAAAAKPDFSQKMSSVDDYDMQQLLGQGHFAQVYKCRHRSTGMVYAMKVVAKTKLVEDKNKEHMRREIAIMQMLKHAHVVSMCDFMEGPHRFFIVLEFVAGGDLQEMMDANGAFPEPVAKRYISQLFDGLGYCHSAGICHRDLKPENLMIDAGDNIKIADFGLGNFTENKEGESELFTRCGSPYYVAPEVIYSTASKGYDGKLADIWSCGVILYQMITGRLPFKTDNFQTLYNLIRSCHYVEVGLPDEAAAFIRKLLTPVKDRVTLDKIGAEPWFKDIKMSAYAANTLKPTEDNIRNAIRKAHSINKAQSASKKPSLNVCSKVEIQQKKFLSNATMYTNARMSIVDNKIHVVVENKEVVEPPFPLPLSCVLAVKLRKNDTGGTFIKVELQKQKTKVKIPHKMLFVFHGTTEADKKATMMLHETMQAVVESSPAE